MRVLVKSGTILFQRPGEVKLTVLKADTQFYLVSALAQWIEIDYQSGAWVEKSSVQTLSEPIPNPIPVPIPEPEPVVVSGVKVKAGTIIYQRPGEVKLKVLEINEFFKVLGEQNQWIKIEYGKTGGYVAKSATTYVTNQPPAPSPVTSISPSASPSSEEQPPDSDISVPPKAVPNGPFLYSLPDYVSRNGKNHPATRSPLTTKMFRMNSKWTAYMLALGKILNPNMSNTEFMQNFKSLFNGTRAFDNGNGFESGDWKLANIYTAGATFKRIGNSVKSFDGRVWKKVKAIPYGSVPKIPTKLSDIDMTLHFFPTTATSIGNNPFPQFGGRYVVPFIAAEWNIIDGYFNWVDTTGYTDRPGTMIEVDAIGHPFVPARWDITTGIIDM